MVKFGDKLIAEAVPRWKHAYVDYASLRRQLKIMKQQAGSNTEPMKQLFQLHLDAEIHKVLVFFQSETQQVGEQVEELQQEQAHILQLLREADKGSYREQELYDLATEKLRGAWRAVGRDVADLLLYVSLNMAAIRKILKKMRKMVGALAPDPKVGVSSVLHISHPTEDSKIMEGSFLEEEVVKQLKDMQDGTRLRALEDAASEGLMALHLLDEHGDQEDTLAPLSPTTVRQREPVLRQMSMARHLAQHDSRLVAATTDLIAAQAAIFQPPPPDSKATATSLGLMLNALNVFLYMANYNLVLPMNAQFCEHLGYSPSVGGIIIGAADVTALLASVFYSAWTHYSFRSPLVFAAVCCLLGNIAYSASYDLKSLALLIVGRFLTGAGAARALNRRYIADFVSHRDRTRASAGFVAASAAGMAAGPLLSFPLAALPASPPSFPVTLNDITVAGWLMAAVWVAFIALALACFPEPRPPTRLPFFRPKKPAAGPQDAAREPLLLQDEEAASGSSSVGAPAAASGRGPVLNRALTLARKRASGFGAAVLICGLWLLVLKLLQQGALASLPMITGPAFGWTNATMGLFLGVCGLASLPTNFITGMLSSKVQDRTLALGLIAILGLGCFSISVPLLASAASHSHHSHALRAWQYFPGFCMVFFSTLILEAVAMSLMSKVISPDMAAGLFNAGLLATSSGSTGRFLGNIYVTVLGTLVGVGEDGSGARVRQVWDFAVAMYGSYGALAAGVLGLSAMYYGSLASKVRQ